MTSWVRAILRIYEFSVILVITILPALATVYAIIVSFLGRIVKRAKEEFERVKEEVEGNIALEEKKLPRKRGRKPKTVKDALAEIEKLRKKLKELEKEQKSREGKLKELSFSCIFAKPAVWTLGGLLFAFSAYVWLSVIPSTWSGFWLIAPSVSLYLTGLAFVAVGVFRYIIPRLKDVDRFAREPEETPLEKLEGVLRKQTEQSKQEYRETFDRLIEKLDEVATGLDRLYSLKEAKFEINFEVDDKIVDTLRIKKGEEQGACLVVDNDSRFPVKDTVVELALPEGFALRRRTQDTPAPPRPATIDPYPGGAALRVELQTLPSETSQRIRFLIKGENAGTFEMIVWVYSTTHERHPTTLNVIVEE